MARRYRLALAAAGAAVVVAVVPLGAGALTARDDTVCLDNWAVPRPEPTERLYAESDGNDGQVREVGRAESGHFVEDAAGCELAVPAPRSSTPGVAWIAVLLASAAAGAAAWWLAGGTRGRTAPATGAAATDPPSSQPPSPVGPVTLTPFGEHGGYVDLPHGVVVWATEQRVGPAGGPGLRPGEPVYIRPGPGPTRGWVVGRDTLTP
jgi:hypothetical protein